MQIKIVTHRLDKYNINDITKAVGSTQVCINTHLVCEIRPIL